MGDIIGLGYGGTGTSTAFTAGSILFSDGTSLAQNNSNFFWDDTNNRLGIGTSTPSATLDIFGTVGDDILNIASSSGDSLFHISNNGNIGIGSTSPQYNLAIEGTLYATDIYTSSSTFYMDGTPLLSKSTGDLVLSVDTGEGINMTVDGTSALYINASGNIGIGTVSPDLFKLQVAGNIGPNTNNTYSLGGVEEMAMDTDLSTADASFWGEDASDGSGISVSGIGDINGDGYDDFAIGAKDEDDGGSNAGQTYVIMGTSSGWAMDTDLSAADASFWGEYADDWSGNSVSGIGDINGDGYDDFAIGAWGNDDGGSAAGQTYVIFGKASGWAMDTELGTSSDASFWGEDSNDVGGRSVSGIGDINGDGYDDFAIGAWGDEDGGDFFAGQTYIILGKASGWAMDTDLSAADASFWGEDASDQAGYSVSGIGDTNGDGYDDFAIGAYRDEDGGSDAGQTYVILGKASGWAMDTDLSTADASFWGEDAGDYSGYSVSGIGDINGDGYADFAIGAYGDDDGGSGAGQTYVILGKASGWAMDTELGTSSDASFWGEDAGDYSGYSVSGIGDINGDGYADFAIGADGDEDGGSAAGQTYIILGKDSGWEMDIELGTSSDASFWGEDASDNSGASVSGIGDINGDGYDDFAIGAYGDDDGGIAAGQTYVILGKPRQFDSVIARHLNAGESLSVGTNLSIHGETITADSQLYLDANMVNINGGLSTTGNVGIGTSSPNSLIDIYSASPADTDIIFSIATATNVTYKIQADGTVYSDNAYNATGADYAEYFYTEDTDLVSGEVVCVDILNDNAVARCYRESDTNVMGIVSSNPSIIGNSKDTYKDDKNMVIVGMLGQVPARVTDENGSIRPGDSLTSASLAGYLMRASSSAPTVGVALESLDSGIGNINVLISRKNKSITVEEVEEKVTERIAAMEIEDEVNILIANAVDSLNLDDQISSIVDDELLLVDARLTIEVDTLTGLINNNKSNINNLMSRVAVVENDITDIKSRLDMLDIGTTTNPITSDTFAINEDGTIRLGNNIDNNISTTTIGTSTVEIVDAPVAIVDIEADSELTAFVVNQVSSGDVADFQSDGVSIVNIANEGEVRVVGEMLVDGRIMLCSGGSCGDALDNAVDETMGDMGVEGKVVAGAFENYCDEGFVWVEGSAKYGTMPGFCVMSDEAKFADMNGDGIAEMDMLVDLQGPTWDNMNQGEAKLTCESLGSGYHLISENEWMTIADSIIKVADNDMDDELEGLQLESPLKRSGCETDEVCLATTATSTVQILANGNEISNIGAGLGEWTDKIVTKAGVPTPLTNDWQEFYAVEDYKGFNIIPPYYYSSENGIGMIKTGDNDQAMRGFVRGTNGVFSLDISNSPVIATSTIGFRCAK
ncbi:MAG: integrin alpha [Thiomicrorhabdus sp.]|nr:integrin alpha [Thiomicrorhabdus sp.]